MNETMVPSRNPFQRLAHNFKLLIPAILLFAILSGFQIWRLYDGSKPVLQSNGVPINIEMEERFGVRFTGVHVVGKTGLIDLRYRVLDVSKAKIFGHFTETSPMLISEVNGKTVEVTIMGLHNHRVEAGRSYYILYRNTDNALTPGSRVTLQIDDMILKNVPVQ